MVQRELSSETKQTSALQPAGGNETEDVYRRDAHLLLLDPLKRPDMGIK